MKEYLKLLFRAWKYRLADNREEISYLLRSIQRGDTVLDVGAHKGGYTYWMHKAAGPRGKVVAFEPQRKGACLLQDLFRGTGVQVEHKAVSNRIGQQELFIQPQSYEISFEASLENKYGDALTEQVETTTIDQYCADHELRPSFIKIDVEGHEGKVLEGAMNVLDADKPLLLVECENRHSGSEAVEHLYRFLQRYQYKGFFYRQEKIIPIEAFDPLQHQRTSQAGTKHYINNFYFEPDLRT